MMTGRGCPLERWISVYPSLLPLRTKSCTWSARPSSCRQRETTNLVELQSLRVLIFIVHDDQLASSMISRNIKAFTLRMTVKPVVSVWTGLEMGAGQEPAAAATATAASYAASGCALGTLTLGFPPSPMHSALTSELLPVPAKRQAHGFGDPDMCSRVSLRVIKSVIKTNTLPHTSAPLGPSTRFRRGPGSMTAS